MNYLRFFNLYFCDYVYMYIYVMILRFLFFIQTFLKYCKALSTEKYKRYINILLLLLLSWSDTSCFSPKTAGY